MDEYPFGLPVLYDPCHSCGEPVAYTNEDDKQTDDEGRLTCLDCLVPA